VLLSKRRLRLLNAQDGQNFDVLNRQLFQPTCGQEESIQHGHPGEVVGKIEGLLGGEEKIRQEVT